MKLFLFGKRIKYAFRKHIYRIYFRFLGPLIVNTSPQTILKSAILPDFHTVNQLIEKRRTEKAGIFFSQDLNVSTFSKFIESNYPGCVNLYIHRANQVCDHVFDILGSGPTWLGDSIDWHYDFIHKHHWKANAFFSDIYPAVYPGGYDIKVPWELSRCHHLVWLGQAYFLSGDEKYSREFADQILNWIESNTYPLGVNWASTMEVAIRVINWLLAYIFFVRSPTLTDEFHLVFLKSLLLHGRHIRNNLEWSPKLTTNHYLSNIVGLIFLGFLSPEFKESAQWLRFGLHELTQEMEKQVFPDGVGKEASTSYHRLLTELFLSATILAERNGFKFSQGYIDRLEKMLEVIMHLSRHDGTSPLLGDNDNGRLYRFHLFPNPDREWNDYRYLLAIGAEVFQRDDFNWGAGDQWLECYWLFGSTTKESLRKSDIPATQLSRGFSHGGWYILRHADLHVMINAGANGQNGIGGHAHNDKLSITIYGHGQDWIIDPGMYCYTSDFEKRLLFRSTAFHNTVRIDKQEQNRLIPDQAFSLKNDATIAQHRWEINPNYDLFDASHNGYHRLRHPITHRRQILFWKVQDPYLIIKDTVAGEGYHSLELFFQIGNVETEFLTPRLIYLQHPIDPSKGLGIFSLGDPLPKFEIVDHYQSPGYGRQTPSKAIRYSYAKQLPTTSLTVFIWHAYPNIPDECFTQLRQMLEPGLQLLS